jgi:uncharacterized membrane protein YqiK
LFTWYSWIHSDFNFNNFDCIIIVVIIIIIIVIIIVIFIIIIVCKSVTG